MLGLKLLLKFLHHSIDIFFIVFFSEHSFQFLISVFIVDLNFHILLCELVKFCLIDHSLFIDGVRFLEQSECCFVHFVVFELSDLILENIFPGADTVNLFLFLLHFFACSQCILSIAVGYLLLCLFPQLCYLLLFFAHHELKLINLFA